MADALSEALRAVRLAGAVFMTGWFRAPWSILTENAPMWRMMPTVDHLIHFHYVLDGQCHAQVAGGSETALARAGDVIVFAQGDEHQLASAPMLAPTPIGVLLPKASSEPFLQLEHGGTGAATMIVCGFLACDPRLCRALLHGLPRLMVLPLREGSASTWIDATVQHTLIEARSGRAGAAAMLSRLAELLFVEALRRHVEISGQQRAGWLAAIGDPIVGRALALIHERPAHGWTVESLASESACSRSVLAERFADLLGSPPMRYLARWRLAVAASQLRSQDGARVSRLAEEVGYASETAFNRAFKREYGHSPLRWRRQFAS